ncbi:hypothetical protein M378DRAFT_188670 [Amanita muscaria Koide BX008]|uniref:Uncharacterized protein n=1 Tax=Amanita muscaria (strain Koide BX008) TaxID=946122 RepID=A0A0C2WGZ7_AMAMK|nr:hypothetical protein M378DRAFT_188670 [Amanita muscaria Koide BX008]
MTVPGAEELRQIQQEYLSRTAQSALEEGVCGVCARETPKAELTRKELGQLPNPLLLRPIKSHRAQELHQGMLLEPAGTVSQGGIGRTCDPSTLQRGMVGNVTSFPLNTREIIEMIQGQKLPQPPRILPAVIAVTFVGAKIFPKNWLKGVLRVRREKVATALRWLITNNPLYQKFTLDQERLAELPEDDVPIEILAIVRQEPDSSVLAEEADSYVPGDLELDSCIETQTDRDTVMNAIENLAREGTYDVRPGQRFVRDLPDRKGTGEDTENYSACAFPSLFPYGTGGVESQAALGFIEHIRYCLLFHDRRFRTHHSFPFVMFGLYQKRQALAAARIQVMRRDFDQVRSNILQVTREDLTKAASEREKGMPISNKNVQKLLDSAKLTAGRIVGTDQSRAALRSKIWSTAVFLGPPSIWMTINPADIHDPIAQLLCGEEINIDQFDDLQGRCANNVVRAQNIAKDPYAAAKYFHTLILIVLEALVGIRVTSRMTYSKKGLLGRVSAYTGAVESQNRASLHLHILLWLVGAPRATELREKFQSEEFRDKVRKFVEANIHAGAPGLTEQALATIPRESDLAYARPPNPAASDFEQQFTRRLLSLARNMQVHVCVKGACKRYDLMKGTWACKRHAPWPVSEVVVVNADGTWSPIRQFGMVNNFHPQILVFVQCNSDIKLLTNGKETKNITWYIAKYATKPQKRLFNASALLASSLAFHYEDNTYIDDVKARSRLLLFRCFQGLNRQQEQSAPQVISYLMGWDDCFLSHEFVPLYLSSLQAYLRKLIKAYVTARR